jgi:hypothetical protein
MWRISCTDASCKEKTRAWDIVDLPADLNFCGPLPMLKLVFAANCGLA